MAEEKYDFERIKEMLDRKYEAWVADGRPVEDEPPDTITSRSTIQLHRDPFGCDQALLRVFLEACDWPVDRDFPHKALGLALHRQAVGLAQHHTMDVFEPLAALLPLRDIATLDDLATALFGV